MALSSFFRLRQTGGAAGALYQAAVAQARRPEFYLSLGVADTVDGRFDLLALHAFLLLHRLGEIGRDAKGLSQEVFDLMFADMDANLREMGVSDLAVGGRVKTMAKAFYGRVSAYDAGLTREDGLHDALLRNLYRGTSPGAAILDAMVDYTRASASLLAGQAIEALRAGRVQFADPPALAGGTDRISSSPVGEHA
ncbi:MAG: hypothetical protein F8N37_07120 [Telmatospirillum sp.]|nr:hypothetical protein [Telmatospirillum sp.]